MEFTRLRRSIRVKIIHNVYMYVGLYKEQIVGVKSNSIRAWMERWVVSLIISRLGQRDETALSLRGNLGF